MLVKEDFMKFEKSMITGILTCLLIAVPAWILGKTFPVIGGPVFGILFGIILAFFKRPEKLEKGIKYTSKKILQYSIILLGFEMNLFNVIKVGGQSLLVMIFTLSASFLTAYFVGKALKIDSNTTVLIGVGTSICGGSAIAATAPVIRAKDEDVAQAISTIFLFNIIAVFIFPALGHAIGLSDTGFGMWAGTAINDTSSVVAAGASWSSAAGNNTALAFATIVKLTRTLMIVPITLVLAIYTSRKISRENSTEGFSFIKVFPWFVLGFVLTAILNTFLPIPDEFSAMLVQIGKFMIVMAMTAIGLNTNLKKLLTNGIKPIGLGLCCWFMVAVVSLVVQKVIGFI
jgi:uncharacterized integral membrane protein (TIGR00698 family)